jgi:hypothetical protein
MSDTPLKRGDVVRILADDPVPPSEKPPELEIEVAGRAGFKVKKRLQMFPWFERNITWSSDLLDRLDKTKDQFSRAATGCERNT